MCGRYASARKRHELLEEFKVERDATPEEELPADYNVAPTKRVYAVVSRLAGVADSRHAGDTESRHPEEAPTERQLRLVKWGLVPPWAKDPAIGNKMINARVETVAEKPAYRRAFKRRRCLLPADGYYEWYEQEKPEGATKKPPKQPYFIHRADGASLAMAGLYELWKDAEGEWLWTVTIITTNAVDKLGRIHDRMPVLIDPAQWSKWLDPGLQEAEAVQELLKKPDGLAAYPVSTAVNNVRNNGRELVEPLPQEGISGEYVPTLF